MAKTLSYAQWQQRVFSLQRKAQVADDAMQAAMDRAGESRWAPMGSKHSPAVKRAISRYHRASAVWHAAVQKMRAAESRGNRGNMAKKRTPKFGSAAWRKLYGPGGTKRKNKAKRKTTARRKPAKRKTAKRKNTAVRNNPPRKWTKVKSVRVIRKGGRDVLEIRK